MTMFDITGISVFAVLLLKILLWGVVLLNGYVLGKRLVAHVRAGQGSAIGRCERAIRANAMKTFSSLLLLVAVAYFTVAEGPYRPKTAIDRPSDDPPGERDVPEFRPEKPKPAWEDVQRKNAEENEKSRREFEKLPAVGE